MSAKLGRIRTHSLADQARDLLRNAILEGRYLPAERLTIERIASEFGISRTPVREALKALETDGIVRIHPHRGAIVQRFEKDELRERYSLRALLEGYAGELACKRDPDIATALCANCDELERTISRQSDKRDPEFKSIAHMMDLNTRFHGLIMAASGSETTVRLLETLKMPLAYRASIWSVPGRQKKALQFHREIADAFRARKPRQVRRLLEGHLIEARDFVLSEL